MVPPVVCRVIELFRQPRPLRVCRVLLGDALRFLDAFRTGREDELRAKGLEQLAALHRHRVGHHQRALVALCRGHEGQADAGVAARRFDDGLPRFELARLLRFADHGDGDAIFDRGERIEGFQFRSHLRRSGGDDAVEPHERRAPDQLGDVVVDLSVHCSSSCIAPPKTKDPSGMPGSHSMNSGCCPRLRSLERTLEAAATDDRLHVARDAMTVGGGCQCGRAVSGLRGLAVGVAGLLGC